MALIQCHECSKEVSDEALAACPHCGAPKADAQPSKKKPKREPISLEDWEGRGGGLLTSCGDTAKKEK